MNFLDFEQVVTIDAGTTKACTNFLIVDDDIFMEGNETFQLEIMLLLPLPITTPTTTVTIIDDDGTYVSSIVNVLGTSTILSLLNKFLQMHLHTFNLSYINPILVMLSFLSSSFGMLPCCVHRTTPAQ